MAKVSAIMPAIMPVTATLIVLALATLDDATQIGSFLLPKVSKYVSLSHSIIAGVIALNIVNVNDPIYGRKKFYNNWIRRVSYPRRASKIFPSTSA